MSTIRATNFQHASAAAPAIVLAADGTAAATFSGINGGPLAGFRNAIINGNFDVWQRGTSVAGFGMVTADRWTTRNAVNTGGSLTQSRQPFTLGQTEVPGEPKFYWRLVFSGATGTPYVVHRIEGVRSFAGQTVTLSFWARRSSPSSSCYVDMTQSFGTGGSPSAVVTTSSTTFEVGTSWTYVTLTFGIPSITGKTLGTDDNDYLEIRIWLGGTSSFTFELAQVQVEAGPVATPFERRPIAAELALCQRYFIQWTAGRRIGVGARGTINATYRTAVTLPVALRGLATLTWSDIDVTSGTDVVAVNSFNNLFALGNTLQFDAVVASTTLDSCVISPSIGNNGFFRLDAEL